MMSKRIPLLIFLLLSVPCSFAAENWTNASHSDGVWNMTSRGSGVAFVDGAVVFNGTASGDDIFRIAADSRTVPWANITDKPFTMSAWFRIPQNNSFTRSIFDTLSFTTGCATGYGNGCAGWFFRVNTNLIQFGSVTSNYSATAQIPLTCIQQLSWGNDLGWHHIAVTHNGSKGANVIFYLDGVERNITSTSSCSLWSSGVEYWGVLRSAALCIGEDCSHSGIGGNWSADDIRFYNRTLTRAEILSVRNNESVQVPSLAARYAFDEARQNNPDCVASNLAASTTLASYSNGGLPRFLNTGCYYNVPSVVTTTCTRTGCA
jgi:hypothetical protein